MYDYNLHEMRSVLVQVNTTKNNYEKPLNRNKRPRLKCNQGPLTCFYCNKKYKTKDTLRKHIQLMHISTQDAPQHRRERKLTVASISIERKQCCKCGAKFDSEELLRAHFDNNHPIELVEKSYPNAYIFGCDFCFGKFKKRSHLEAHYEIVDFEEQSPRRKSSTTSHICPHCGKVLTKRRFLDLHIASFHETSKDFSCPVCTKKFSHEKLLKKHIGTAHATDTFT